MIAVAPGSMDYDDVFGTAALMAHGEHGGSAEFDFSDFSNFQQFPVCDMHRSPHSSVMPAATAVLSAGQSLDVGPTQATLVARDGMSWAPRLCRRCKP